MSSTRFLEAPEIPSTSIQKNRDKEKIHEPTGLFLGVAILLIPFGQQAVYAGNPADFEMLPATMRWDEVISVGTEVALWNTLAYVLW
jgi:hypothetical protein